MSTSISSMATSLLQANAWQRFPVTLTSNDYENFMTDGIKRFYSDMNLESSWDTDYDSTNKTIVRDLTTNEYEYCMICGKIEVLKKLQTSWNDLVGYTTNALSVTNISKPFENIDKTINAHEKRLVTLFHKIVDLSTMSDIDTITVEQVEYDYDS
jgi:hypothetical protein